ncbi:hypothetical protein ACLGIH_33025 [Streptomyces sp. HMX87]|uniref:hypothetical protein n=1 Tax=Streptomyces sp. HMX87 TaxID=3390849 RepID=UPI003A8C0793
MKRTFVSACAGVVIVAVTTAGCTAAATDDPAGSDRRQRSGSTGAAEAGGQGRELTDAERILVQRAEQTLVKECMEKEGFKYWIGPLPTVDELKGGGYVLTDVGWAKRHGYGSRLRARLQDLQSSDPNHAYAGTLAQEERVRYSKTLEGGPSSGMLTAELPGGGTVRTPGRSCQVEAKEQLYGDFETWFRAEKTATNLSSLYTSALLEDKRFVRALESWSACMRKAGHAYADPPEIRAKLPALTEGLSAQKAYATEVEVAVAEATCATGTPLARTARELDDEYRKKQLERYGEDVATYERMSLTALARAEDITGSTA